MFEGLIGRTEINSQSGHRRNHMRRSRGDFDRDSVGYVLS
jgi:hypothetical protein